MTLNASPPATDRGGTLSLMGEKVQSVENPLPLGRGGTRQMSGGWVRLS